MVCHQTYKDQKNNWLNPEEVISKDNINFFVKKSPSEKVIVGPSESMSKSKKHSRSRKNDNSIWCRCCKTIYFI